MDTFRSFEIIRANVSSLFRYQAVRTIRQMTRWSALRSLPLPASIRKRISKRRKVVRVNTQIRNLWDVSWRPAIFASNCRNSLHQLRVPIANASATAPRPARKVARYEDQLCEDISLIWFSIITRLFEFLQFFYAISDIKIRGRCVCNGHASACDPDGSTGQMKCRCEHNTCGKYCDQCCPKFSAKPWTHNDTCARKSLW